jgi:hypothetical protein
MFSLKITFVCLIVKSFLLLPFLDIFRLHVAVKSLKNRALPDITSGPEVQQILKIQTVRKPDLFLPGTPDF